MGPLLNVYALLLPRSKNAAEFLNACVNLDPKNLTHPEQVFLLESDSPYAYEAGAPLPTIESGVDFLLYYQGEKWPKPSVGFKGGDAFLSLSVALPGYPDISHVSQKVISFWNALSEKASVLAIAVGFELNGIDNLSDDSNQMVAELLGDYCIEYALVDKNLGIDFGVKRSVVNYQVEAGFDNFVELKRDPNISSS
jgi:hypothetical protein